MTSWLEFIGIFIAANVPTCLLIEYRSRALQRDLFAQALRTADEKMRLAGWTLIEASFKPGYLEGHGYIRWIHPDGCEWVAEPTIDGRATTRSVAYWWKK